MQSLELIHLKNWRVSWACSLVVKRLIRIEETVGSIPARSTIA